MLEWDDPEHTIMLLHYPENYTADEAVHLMRRARECIISVDHRVDLVFILPRMYLPTGDVISATRDLIAAIPPNVRFRLVVGGIPYLFRQYVRMISRDHARWQFVDSVDEARATICEARATT